MPTATQDVDFSSGDDRLNFLLAMLNEALAVADSLGDCPEIGARLQEIIDALEERLRI